MDFLWNQIQEWIKEALVGGITANFTGMFDEINTKVGEIATQVGQTPQGWNGSIFSMIRSLSDTVIIPIAGMILTFVMCYELINMIIDKNNMHDTDTFMFFKWIFKTFVAVYIVTHTFDIVMAVFGMAQHVVQGSAGIISGSTNITLQLDTLQQTLEAMEWSALIGLYMESLILSFAMKAISLCIFIVIVGRMIEIYVFCSIAAIPLSTMVNRDWGQMGNNYLKSLFALGFQGFLIMICVAIYAVLVQGITVSDNIHVAIWTCAGYTVLLCFALFMTGRIAKSIFNAH